MRNIKLGAALIFLFAASGVAYNLYESHQEEQHRIYLAEQAKEKKRIFDFALDLNPNQFVPTGNIHVDGVSQSCRGVELRSRVDAFHRYVEHLYDNLHGGLRQHSVEQKSITLFLLYILSLLHDQQITRAYPAYYY